MLIEERPPPRIVGRQPTDETRSEIRSRDLVAEMDESVAEIDGYPQPPGAIDDRVDVELAPIVGGQFREFLPDPVILARVEHPKVSHRLEPIEYLPAGLGRQAGARFQ